MKIYTEIIGNIHQSPDWEGKLKAMEVETIYLDQWTAQKSRFLAKSDKGNEYPVALKRHSQVVDGDIIYYMFIYVNKVFSYIWKYSRL